MKSLCKPIILFCLLLFPLLLFCACTKDTSGTDSLGQSYDLRSDYLVTQYADATGQHGTFYTIENDRYFLIIDGGWAGNADAVRSVIAAHGNTVDAWMISHPHQDHAGAFNAIASDPQGIVIEQIYDNGLDFDFIEENGEPYDDITVMETYHGLTKDTDNVTHLRRGEQLEICGLTVDVFNAFDETVLSNVGGEQDFQNNASLMLKITNKNDSILFCSDIKYDMETVLNDTLTDEQLACAYVQTGHHGNWSFSKDFYLRTGAKVFFLDAPSAITDSADYPASSLKTALTQENGTVLDFRTAPNTVVLK